MIVIIILALESSAKAASAAIWENGSCKALYYQNCGLTHSKTLLPMAESMIHNTGLKSEFLNLIAVARGPGSFTGIRIGIATAKGLMWGLDKPGCGVSTLESMAWQAVHMKDYIVCAVMDARRSQVYNALFAAGQNKPLRLSEDRAISIDDLRFELEKAGQHIILIGDGAELCLSEFNKTGIKADVMLAPENIRYQSAWGVALAAADIDSSLWKEPEPVYLRLSQAERERLERLEKET